MTRELTSEEQALILEAINELHRVEAVPDSISTTTTATTSNGVALEAAFHNPMEYPTGVMVDTTVPSQPTNDQEEEEVEEEEDPIPTNPTLEDSDPTLRFKGASWAELMRTIKVTIGGVGGIGSWTSLLVSRLNPYTIKLYDPDRIERVNLAGQLFRETAIGTAKVQEASWIINNFSYYYSIETFASTAIISPIFIAGFDNMSARSYNFHTWREKYGNDPKAIFIDGRLAAEEFQVYCVLGGDEYSINRYKDTLFNDSEAEEPICSYKQTSYMAAMIAAIITNLLVNFVANMTGLEFRRDLPFLTRYDAKTMFFKTEN